MKTVKKKQKNKGKGGQSRTVTKTVPNETFFNMFSDPKGMHACLRSQHNALVSRERHSEWPVC